MKKVSAAPRACASCGKENRTEACYCRFCGSNLSSPAEPRNDLESLVGLTELRAEFESLDASLRAMKAGGSALRLNHHTIIMGNSGTGKSRLSTMFCEILARHGSIRSYPLLLNAPDVEGMDSREFEKIFTSASGGALILDNAQLLLRDGEPGGGLNRILGLMDRFPLDPVVIFTGLPFGLRELLKKEENRHITGRFKNIFLIHDYDSSVLSGIAVQELSALGLTLTPEAGLRLGKRFEYLVRESRKTDSAIESRNGYLARNIVQDIVRSYYLREAEDGLVLPGDISGDIEEEKSLTDAMKELDSFVGLADLKKALGTIAAQVRVRKEREESGGSPASPVAFHFVLTGNPGTGKTTVTRVLGEILRAVGMLEMGHVVETDRSRLVGQYVGQTAPLVNRYCDMALGGILFIDEAYALSRGDDTKDFGREAIETLLKRMEDDRGKFVVVTAGYTREMEGFLASNPGLRSRFTHRFELPDYTALELFQIFRLIAKRHGYRLIEGKAEAKLIALFSGMVQRKTRSFANGRDARSVFEETERRHAKRLADAFPGERPDTEEYAVIRAEDVPGRGETGAGSLREAFQTLDELAGLSRVKTRIHEIADMVEVNRLRGQDRPVALHMVFAGNPGTGKTTVARCLADILYHLGIIPEKKIVEADRGSLVARYAGQTAPLVNEACDRAMGGILFIDEAYAFVQEGTDPFGREAVETLLKRMEDDRGKFVVVTAGYPREMEAFLSSNPGFRSRFTDFIRFDDFTGAEMLKIFRRFARDEGYKLTKGLTGALEKILEDMYVRRGKDFANGRTVRDLFEKIRTRQSSRIRKLRESGMIDTVLHAEADILKLEDIPGIERFLAPKETGP